MGLGRGGFKRGPLITEGAPGAASRAERKMRDRRLTPLPGIPGFRGAPGAAAISQRAGIGAGSGGKGSPGMGEARWRGSWKARDAMKGIIGTGRQGQALAFPG